MEVKDEYSLLDSQVACPAELQGFFFLLAISPAHHHHILTDLSERRRRAGASRLLAVDRIQRLIHEQRPRIDEIDPRRRGLGQRRAVVEKKRATDDAWEWRCGVKTSVQINVCEDGI